MTEARAMVSGNEAVIATLNIEIEKLKRALYGQKSERKARLLDQLELRLGGRRHRGRAGRRAGRFLRTCRASGW